MTTPEQIEALQRVAAATRRAGGGVSRSGKSCSYCEGRLDRPPGHIQSPCRGPGCPGHELREAIAALDLAEAGPPYGIWVIPAPGETSWPEGRWAETATGTLHEYESLGEAELFAGMARRVSRASWRYEVRSRASKTETP
jgi:hypothetical protein